MLGSLLRLHRRTGVLGRVMNIHKRNFTIRRIVIRRPALHTAGFHRVRKATTAAKEATAKARSRNRGKDESFAAFLKRNSGIIFFGTGCCVTAYLAAWQTQRYFWKKELIVSRAELVSSDGLPLLQLAANADVAALDALQFTPITVEGTLALEHTVFVGPRSKPSTGDSGNQAKSGLFSTGTGGNGVHVLTPLITNDPAVPMVIVDRGWIPKDAIEEFKKMESKRGVPEPTVFTGVVMKGEQLNLPGFSETSQTSDQYLYRDLTTLTRRAKIDTTSAFTSNFYIAALPRGQDTDLVQKSEDGYVDFTIEPETHAGYAATWTLLTVFGLAIARYRFFK